MDMGGWIDGAITKYNVTHAYKSQFQSIRLQLILTDRIYNIMLYNKI